jgi:vacuolar-type H+-ATPase subunit I/STV1
MKSSYELAMERLNKNTPTVRLTAAHKKQLAELDSQYAAKIAGREIAMKSEIAGAADDFEKVEKLRGQWIQERQKLQAELEAKKEQIRHEAGR